MCVRAVDLFCGAGGLTLGLRQAGISVVAGYDVNADCKYPFTKNNASRFEEADLSKPDLDRLREDLSGEGPTLIAGCAPCQRFSSYDRRRRGSGEAWPLLDAFGSIVANLRPSYVTMENVPGLERDAAFHRFHRTLTTSGYHVVYDVLDCSLFGVPQSRKRLVLLASLQGHIELPDPTHPRPEDQLTVADAISEVSPLSAGEADPHDDLHYAARMSEINLKRIKASRPGGTWEDWPEDLRAPCHRRASGAKYKSVYGRMEWNKPAPTITGQATGFGNGRFGHPDQPRSITLREAALLQTFPADYAFCETNTSPGAGRLGVLIGNAVPPRLGFVIGQKVTAHAIALKERLGPRITEEMTSTLVDCELGRVGQSGREG